MGRHYIDHTCVLTPDTAGMSGYVYKIQDVILPMPWTCPHALSCHPPWITPCCLDVSMLPRCPQAPWISPCSLDVSMFRGCLHVPLMPQCSHAPWMSPCSLDIPMLSGCPHAVWMSPCFLDVLKLPGCPQAPRCPHAPWMSSSSPDDPMLSGWPHAPWMSPMLPGCPPCYLDVLMLPGCPHALWMSSVCPHTAWLFKSIPDLLRQEWHNVGLCKHAVQVKKTVINSNGHYPDCISQTDNLQTTEHW